MREQNKANAQIAPSAAASHPSLFQDERRPQPRIHEGVHEIAVEPGDGPVRRGERSLLFRLLDALSAETELGSFLGRVVVAVAEQFAAHSAYLCIYCEDQNVLRLEGRFVWKGMATRSSQTVSPQLPRTAPAGSLWQELLRTRRPLFIADATKDRRVPFRDVLLVDGVKQLLLVPLVSGTDVLGFIGIMLPGLHSCVAEQIELAQSLAQVAGLALRLARIADHASQRAVLEERSRMARDLHDTIAKGFTGILIQLDLAESILARNNPKALRHIVRARELARESLIETRRSVFALHPLLLAKNCLAKALQQLAAQLTSDTKLRTEFCFQGVAPVLSPEMEAELLHIGQEALTNILKHSHSTKIRIEFAAYARYLRLSIQDDGTGFDHSRPSTTQSFGIIGMEERARHLGGRLVIDSRPGSGTRVQVTIPLKSKAVAVGRSA